MHHPVHKCKNEITEENLPSSRRARQGNYSLIYVSFVNSILPHIPCTNSSILPPQIRQQLSIKTTFPLRSQDAWKFENNVKTGLSTAGHKATRKLLICTPSICIHWKMQKASRLLLEANKL